MNKLMYRFVYTTKKKKKRNRPVFRHGMPLQGIPRKKEIDPFLDTVCPFRASRVITAKKLCLEYKLLFYPGDELAEGGHLKSLFRPRTFTRFLSTSGNSTAEKLQV